MLKLLKTLKIMEFDNLFDIEPLKSEPLEMDKKEFYEKTHKILTIIDNIYSKGWQNRSMQESDYPEESICDKCKGEGVNKEGVGQCFQNKEYGECYIRFCDYEQIGIELEEFLFNFNSNNNANSDFYELISVEKIK
jgi:hypothetical protein